MLNPEGIPMGANVNEAAPDPNAALRFEDLTIDDDLSLQDRVIRYVRSGIALQRLVHVKMLGETAKSVGTTPTIHRLIPILPALVADPESVIRQHLASQLLAICLTCMFGDDETFDPNNRSNPRSRSYDEEGYRVVASTILNHMNTLITDPDMDVRKSASDALATLTLYIKPDDVALLILPIPLRLAHDNKGRSTGNNQNSSKQNEKDDGGGSDELHITAANLLGDIASLDANQIPPNLVSKYVTPTIMVLCKHPSMRVRRAIVQSLPRVVNGSSIDDIQQNLMPCFVNLSNDDSYRVRKSVGECLVDMSRSLMLLPSSSLSNKPTLEKSSDNASENKNKYSNMKKEELMGVVMNIRRDNLVPICTRLLADTNKIVRNGMMQFLGPFIASFYPLGGQQQKKDGNRSKAGDDNGIINLLSGRDKENEVGGMGVQFFPHANGMVSRLSPASILSQAAGKDIEPLEYPTDTRDHLESLLPKFLEKCFNDAKSLVLILHHRDTHPISPEDSKVLMEELLPPYVKLSTISTGEDNVDAEMRVYCAYSLPAVILLLGAEGWQRSLKNCFLALITGTDESGKNENASSVPLPVKRCLASSYHTICHMLGPAALKGTSEDKTSKRDILSVFEHHFLSDADDTVRFNVIRNLPSFLALLSFSKRSKYLPLLYEIITGDGLLAQKRRSALNPMILNWRQRDMIAQIIPNLIILFKPSQVRQFLWPIVKVLLSDSVNLVRQNVEWSIPVILRSYETKKCKYDNDDIVAASKFSTEACNEVFIFLKATLLDNNPSPSPTAGLNKKKSSSSFSKRQSYCRVLSSIALILRLNDKEQRRLRKKQPKENLDFPPHSFYNLSSDEYRHVHQLLKELFLPHAIVMKDDKVTNVRLALAKCLRVMPLDIRGEGEVSVVLSTLEDEIQTWEGGGGQYMDGNAPQHPSSPNRSNQNGNTASSNNNGKDTSTSMSPDDEAKAAIERGKQQAEQDEKRLKLKKSGTEDDSMSLASI